MPTPIRLPVTSRKSMDELRELARQHIPGADPNIMAAIAMAESGGNYRASNKNRNGSVDKGLWQINSVHGLEKSYDLFSPVGNAKAAGVVFGKQGYTAWSVYKSGKYQEFLRSEDKGGVSVGSVNVSGVGDSVSGVGDSVKRATNAVTETLTRISLSAGALSLALVLIIMGAVILMRGQLGRAATMAGKRNPIGKSLGKVSRVVG